MESLECIRVGGSREELSFYGLPGAMTPHGWRKKIMQNNKIIKNY